MGEGKEPQTPLLYHALSASHASSFPSFKDFCLTLSHSLMAGLLQVFLCPVLASLLTPVLSGPSVC